MMRSGSVRQGLQCSVQAVLCNHRGRRDQCSPWRAVRPLLEEGSQQQSSHQSRDEDIGIAITNARGCSIAFEPDIQTDF